MKDVPMNKLVKQHATLEILADYYQIYVCDPAHDEDWSALWNDQTLDDRIIALEHTVVFGTGRNMLVPIAVFVHDANPDMTKMVSGADHAVSANIMCTSGAFIVAGCTDYLPDAFTLDSGRGSFGVAFLSFDLGTIDGLDGDDRYELHIWPVTELLPPQVLIRFPV
jgi:hypothetical protein